MQVLVLRLRADDDQLFGSNYFGLFSTALDLVDHIGIVCYRRTCSPLRSCCCLSRLQVASLFVVLLPREVEPMMCSVGACFEVSELASLKRMIGKAFLAASSCTKGGVALVHGGKLAWVSAFIAKSVTSGDQVRCVCVRSRHVSLNSPSWSSA